MPGAATLVTFDDKWLPYTESRCGPLPWRCLSNGIDLE
jgi:hypothetical protein